MLVGEGRIYWTGGREGNKERCGEWYKEKEGGAKGGVWRGGGVKPMLTKP